jgi:hypothetical protein
VSPWAPDQEPSTAGTDADTSEVLDLDTSFGLSAFGSERAGSEPAPQPPAGMSAAAPDHERVPEPARSWHGPANDTVAAFPDPPSHAPDGHDLVPTAAPVPAWRSAPAPLQETSSAHVRRWIVLATAAIVIAGLVIGGLWSRRRPGPAPAAVTTGELTVDSTPGGARVIVGGTDRGSTPLSLSLAAGTYDLEHVFLRKPDPKTPGTLRITSEPSSAAVAVDGRGRGTTPLLITDLAAGPHEVVVTGTSGSVRQRVRVDPAGTTTVMVPLPKTAPPQSTGGWLSITTPTELQVFEGDRLLGTTRANRLMLPTGRHDLRLSNEAAGISLTRQVTVERGRTARLRVTVPPGTVNINAVPWAVVSIDGRDAGETPLGGVELSPGSHEVVFTHPELGQRRQQVSVRSGEMTRVSVDLRR